MNEKIRRICLSKRVLCMGVIYAALVWAAIAVVLGTGGAAFAQPVAQTGGKRVCVVVPHFKDEYWLSVGYGLIEEARLTGTELLIFSADDPALLAAVARTARKVPVVALVNELHAPQISGAVGVDWAEMGRVIGRYLSRLHPKGSAAVVATLVTGPARSGWSPLLEAGLAEGLRGSSVQIRHIGRSDTGLHEQLVQVETALHSLPDAGILIGSAPAIEGAMGLAAQPGAARPMLVSTYISHSVRRGLQGGKVAAVAFDAPVEQGRMGLRAALEARLGAFSQQLIGPKIRLVEAGATLPIILSPAELKLRIE